MSKRKRGWLVSEEQRQKGAKPFLQERAKGKAQTKKPRVDSEPTKRVRTWLLSAILALGLLFRLLHFWIISGTAYPRIGNALPLTDMYANWQWAQTILGGDWLGRNTYHPYFEWMKRIAPLETWFQWWGGKEIFQQAPLYPYLLAGLLMVSGGSVTWVLLVQLVIGALQPLVVYRLATRLFDARVGLAGAALTALYGPFIFHQGVVLRDWLPPLLEPLALLALLRARDNTRGWMWAVSGAALGLALLAKETILVFLPVVFLWILFDQRRTWRQAGRAGTWVLVGVLLSLSPLLLRNVAVRAPVFALSNRAAEGIIEGNAADGFPVGLVHPPSMRGILESSQGHLRGVIQETLNTYHGDFVRLFKVQLIKLRALVDPFEVPNNVGFSYGVELSPVLRGTLGYGIVFPLGLAGFFLSLRAWRRHVLVALYGLTMVGGLMAVPILARYRLILVPVLLLYAAVLLVSLSDALRERNAHRVIGTLGLMLAASLVQHVIVPLDERTKDRVHALDYLGAARVYAEDDQFDRAASEMRRLLDKAQRSPRHIEGMPLFETDYRVFLARSLIAQGAWEEAKGQIDLAIAAHARVQAPVSYPYLNFGALYLKMGEPAKAKTFLVRFLELEPEGPLAEKVRRVLARLDDPS